MIAAALSFLGTALAIAGLGLLAPPLRRRGRRDRAVPPLVRSLVALGERAARGRPGPKELEARIAAAGRPGGLGVRELLAAKLAGALVGGLMATPFATVAPGRLGIALLAGGPVAGFVAPDLWLRRRAGERARRVRRELPALLDLLRVTVAAGASLSTALGDVGERARGPLAEEWRAIGRQVALGVPLGQALESMVARLPQPEVVALRAALDRARRHGTPLADALARQASDARLSLRRRVAEDAAKAGPKIQLVVALLLVPSVLLLVAAALVNALLSGGGVSGLA